jgi:hypothetical protein
VGESRESRDFFVLPRGNLPKSAQLAKNLVAVEKEPKQ